MNYRYNINPKTSNYAHGGHVHNLMEKAYQHHNFGGDIYNSSNNSVAQPMPKKSPKLMNYGGMKLAQELIKKYSGQN